MMPDDHNNDHGLDLWFQHDNSSASTGFFGEFSHAPSQCMPTSSSELDSVKGKGVACNSSSSSPSPAALSWETLILDTEQDMERENDHECNIYQQRQLELEQELHALINVGDHNHDDVINSTEAQEDRSTSNEMTLVFHDWLKKNKDIITAEDLRRIKLKRSTVESATRRLGGGQEGMRKLLALILQWVEINHHNRRQAREVLAPSGQPYQFGEQKQQNQWTPQPQFAVGQYSSTIMTPPELQPQPQFFAGQPSIIAPSQPIGGGYFGHGTYNYAFGDGINYPYLQSRNQQFPILESALQPVLMPVPHLSSPPPPRPQAVSSSGVQLAASLAASVTKEARRKRMGMYQRISAPFRHNNHQTQRRNPARVQRKRPNESDQSGCSRR